MDKELAEIFGTLNSAEPTQEELQKVAQLQMLEKIAETNRIDLNQLSDEQILEALQELQGVEKVAAQQAPQAPPASQLTEAEVLFKTAEKMGQIVAHSYVRELKEIMKTAALLKAAEESCAEEKKEEKAEEKKEKKEEGEKESKGLPPALVENMKGKEEGEKKEAADINAVVEKRAYDFLAEAGLVREDGSIVTPQELAAYQAEMQKQAAQRPITQQDIDAAALQTLEKLGYPVEWAR